VSGCVLMWCGGGVWSRRSVWLCVRSWLVRRFVVDGVGGCSCVSVVCSWTAGVKTVCRTCWGDEWIVVVRVRRESRRSMDGGCGWKEEWSAVR